MFRIGSTTLETNLLLCPIAGYCDLPFRLTIRPCGGVGLASTDLVNPQGLLRGVKGSLRLVETDPADNPLCIQLYGRQPDEMAAAAQWAEDHGAVVVDINMGCPVDKVCKTDAGAALLRDPSSAAALASCVVNAVRIPVTVKMRLGWDDDSIVAHQLAPALEDAGVAAITVHGRTALQKFGGTVRRDGIARVVDSVRRIPVIGNGDIRSPQDARQMMQQTGCSAVMIGRAALADPWIFRDTHAYLCTGEIPPPPSVEERIELMHTHFRHMLRLKGERLACALISTRASWYAKKLGPCPQFRERIRHVRSTEQYWQAVEGVIEECHSPRQLMRDRQRVALASANACGAASAGAASA